MAPRSSATVSSPASSPARFSALDVTRTQSGFQGLQPREGQPRRGRSMSGGTTARAAVLYAAGEPLQVQEITLFDPAPNQVIVRLTASGVCHSDLSVIRGTFPFMFPTVLGHEGSGVIESVGSAVTRVEPGDHVVLTWMPPCRQCPACLAGQNVLCDVGLAEAIGSSYATVDGTALVRGLGV